ncbi:MAG: hypothetical protein C0514_06800 [Candidatus Puniceispirillum sp.]|nr:hypothetical protein [Candidatus Puniceispirillum sp.]
MKAAHLGLMSLLASATLLASFEERLDTSPAPVTGAPARPMDLEALRQSAQTCSSQAMGAQSFDQKASLYAASAQIWQVILKNTANPSDAEAATPMAHYANAATFTACPDTRARYWKRANALWDVYFTQFENPPAFTLRSAAWCAHSAADFSSEKVRISLHQRSIDLWDRYLKNSHIPAAFIFEQAATSYWDARLYTQDPEQQEELAIKCAKVWNLCDIHFGPLSWAQRHGAILACDTVVSLTQKEDIRQVYRQRSAQFQAGQSAHASVSQEGTVASE